MGLIVTFIIHRINHHSKYVFIHHATAIQASIHFVAFSAKKKVIRYKIKAFNSIEITTFIFIFVIN
jgi:hypothetical protein